jgi:hypothetical protein
LKTQEQQLNIVFNFEASPKFSAGVKKYAVGLPLKEFTPKETIPEAE